MSELELLVSDKPTLLQRKTMGEKIVSIVETFINDISGK